MPGPWENVVDVSSRLRAAEAERVAALFELRRHMAATGTRKVAGVDEVGVGPLAGPVVAAAVILREEVDLPGLDDSKRLSPTRREQLCEKIRDQAEAFAIGQVEAREIDRTNILRASLEAMRRAVVALAEGVHARSCSRRCAKNSGYRVYAERDHSRRRAGRIDCGGVDSGESPP